MVLHGNKGLIMNTKISSNKMFVVSAPIVLPMCMKVSTNNITHLWHCRYDHLSFKGLDWLIKNEMLKGMSSFKDLENACSYCLRGKQHREAIPNHDKWRAKENLELLYSDVCWPIKITLNGGSRYFITFMYDFSRKTWIYFLHEKAGAFDVFKQFKALVKKRVRPLHQMS